MESVMRTPPMGKCEVLRFESVGEAARYVENGTSKATKDYKDNSASKFYGIGWDKMRKVMRHGDPEAVARVQKVLDKVDASFRDRESVQWLPSVAGAYPVVPDFLAGNPECMRQRQNIEDDRSPLRIFFSVTVSSGVDIGTAQKRGAAAAALAIRLSEDRPVELWATAEMMAGNKTIVQAYRIPTETASAHEIAFGLGSIEVLRRIAFGVHCQHVDGGSGQIHWAWAGTPYSERYMASAREALDANPGDLYLSGGHLDQIREMSSDPVGWVHKQLESQREVAE